MVDCLEKDASAWAILVLTTWVVHGNKEQGRNRRFCNRRRDACSRVMETLIVTTNILWLKDGRNGKLARAAETNNCTFPWMGKLKQYPQPLFTSWCPAVPCRLCANFMTINIHITRFTLAARWMKPQEYQSSQGRSVAWFCRAGFTGLSMGLRLQAFVIMGDPKITALLPSAKKSVRRVYHVLQSCKWCGYLSTCVPQAYSMICDVDRRPSKLYNHYSFVEHRQLWGLLWACFEKGTDLYALYVLQCFAKVPPLWKIHKVC